MASINKVILVGNLGRDPESRSTANGESVATISIATTDRWRDKSNGEMRENTEWHRVVFFSKLADVVTQYLRKGSQIYVEGKLRTRKWQDKETGQDRYTTEIVGDVMQMLGSRQGQGEPSESRAEPRESKARAGSQPQSQADADVGFRDMMDDVPF